MSRSAEAHAARVYLAQSRHFRQRHRGWSFTLLHWAGNARRRLAAQINTPAAAMTVQAGQMELF